jgi:hypothetical protein
MGIGKTVAIQLVGFGQMGIDPAESCGCPPKACG